MGKTETQLSDITHWIAGARVGGAAGRTSEVFNPATGDVTALVRLADAATVDAVARTRPCWIEKSPANVLELAESVSVPEPDFATGSRNPAIGAAMAGSASMRAIVSATCAPRISRR